MFGLTFEKLFILLVIVGLFLGPSRLPVAAAWLGRTARKSRDFARAASQQLEEEIGEPIDWQRLDPRQLDPRRIIREALEDDPPKSTAGAAPRLGDDDRPPPPLTNE
jgi:sec-independent protein translocase protein TatB